MELCKRYTAAWRLFNLRYECMSSSITQVTTNYLATGNHIVNITGDYQIDKLMPGRYDKTRLSAAAIAMFLAEGNAVGLIHIKDCIQIYHDIQEHLNDWLDQCRFAMHADEFPEIMELRLFENLALEVYEHSQKLEPRTEARSALFESLLNMNRRRNLVSTNKWLKQRTNEGSVIKPYISIVDEIERFVAEIR